MFPDQNRIRNWQRPRTESGPWGNIPEMWRMRQSVAGRCDKMDSDKAFVCGLLRT